MIEFKQVLNKSYELVNGMQRRFSSSVASGEGGSKTNQAGRNIEVVHACEDDDEESKQSSHLSFKEVEIGTVCGTLDASEVERFRRMIYRSTRGQVLMHFSNLNADLRNFDGEAVNKSIYVLMF